MGRGGEGEAWGEGARRWDYFTHFTQCHVNVGARTQVSKSPGIHVCIQATTTYRPCSAPHVPDSPPMTGLLSKCSSSSDTVWNLPKPKLNSLPLQRTGKCFTEFLALWERERERETCQCTCTCILYCMYKCSWIMCTCKCYMTFYV